MPDFDTVTTLTIPEEIFSDLGLSSPEDVQVNITYEADGNEVLLKGGTFYESGQEIPDIVYRTMYNTWQMEAQQHHLEARISKADC